MRKLLHLIATRVGKPVYEIERDMPARELADWILFFAEEHRGAQPQSVDDIGPEGFAAAMGADVGAIEHGSESGPPANST